MNSMTGFGHVSKSLKGMDISVDVRTLNSRYFDFRPRLGRELTSLEGELKKEIQLRLGRGRVELYIEVTHKSGNQLELNEALVKNYLDLADSLRKEGLEGRIALQELLNLPGVCVPRKDTAGTETIEADILDALRETLDQVLEARRVEGNALKADLEQRLSQLARYMDDIEGQAEKIGEHYFQKLSTRLDELLGEHELDEGRLAQEVFYYVEKSDIAEEITRLRSHLNRFSEYLNASDEGAIGKTLDFVCQEMNREINTILSKTAIVDISRIAIEAKGEIEKIREQVQNVE